MSIARLNTEYSERPVALTCTAGQLTKTLEHIYDNHDWFGDPIRRHHFQRSLQGVDLTKVRRTLENIGFIEPKGTETELLRKFVRTSGVVGSQNRAAFVVEHVFEAQFREAWAVALAGGSESEVQAALNPRMSIVEAVSTARLLRKIIPLYVSQGWSADLQEEFAAFNQLATSSATTTRRSASRPAARKTTARRVSARKIAEPKAPAKTKAAPALTREQVDKLIFESLQKWDDLDREFRAHLTYLRERYE